MVERFKQVRDGRLGWGLAPRSNGDLCRYSDYADLERQIAELRAKVDVQRQSKEYAQRCCEKAEAENARLRALPLKDEVERVLEPFLPAYRAYIETMNGFTVSGETFAERRFSDGERRDTASEAAYEALAKVTFDDLVAVDALLSRLRAGEQEGWRSMDSAPKDGTPILAIGFYGEKWGDIEEYIYEGEPNFWHCRKRGVCIRPDYAWRYRWMPKLDLPPLTAALSDQGGDRG